MSALKPLLAEAGGPSAGSAFERDAAVVLRRVEDAARGVRASDAGNRRAFLDLLARVLARTAGGAGPDGAPPDVPATNPPRLIVP